MKVWLKPKSITPGVYRLPKGVENPYSDGRISRNWSKAKEFPAGIYVVEENRSLTEAAKEMGIENFEPQMTLRKGSSHISEVFQPRGDLKAELSKLPTRGPLYDQMRSIEQWNALVENLTSAPDDFNTFVAVAGVYLEEHGDLIEELLREEKISLQDVKDAWKRIQERTDDYK